MSDSTYRRPWGTGIQPWSWGRLLRPAAFIPFPSSSSSSSISSRQHQHHQHQHRQQHKTSSKATSSACMLLLVLLIWTSFIPTAVHTEDTPNTGLARRAFFNASLASVAYLPGMALNLTGQTLFSFRTCSEGTLVSQVGANGDRLSITVDDDGGLTMVWTTKDGVSDSVSLGGTSSSSGGSEINSNNGGSLNSGSSSSSDRTAGFYTNNQWYTVDLKYLLGNIYLRLEAGSRLLDSVLVSNSTYRRYLWSLDLSGDSEGLTVGEGFTGCIEQGAGIQFDTATTRGENVRWGQCPLEAPTVRGCDGEYGDDDLQQYNPCYSFPCLNDGTCVANNSVYTCNCPVPFSGLRCERDLGDQACSLEPCKNGGTCSILTGQTRRFICNCPRGFAGVQCENNIDECGSVPCLNGGQCLDQIDGFTCNCEGTGYNGTICETNLDECQSGRPCLNGGTCINTPGSYKCACRTGYDGKNCETDLDECISHPCQNNGVCTDYLGMYACTCATGFTSDNCEINIDDCVNSNCVYPLVCVDGVNDFTCECAPGYQQDDNNQCLDINECSSSPCENGALCVNGENRFVCDCAPGYSGPTCGMDINECDSQPCFNGATCIDQVNQFSCQCVEGFTGPMCSVDINECSPSPCLNGGLCNNLIGMYTCDCQLGYTGVNCEVNIDDCASKPCQNGARCTDGINEFICNCPEGFDGLRCETNINDCATSPCLNGAICNDGVASYTCNCTSAWMGTNCDQQFDACFYKPCQNEATCQPVIGTPNYSCFCPPGFTGNDCQTNIDDCIGHTCQPHQVCVDLIQTYDCQCPTGYEGSQCEIDIDECSSSPCQNGATCRDSVGNYTCICSGQWIDLRNFSGNANHRLWSGYIGRHCETIVNECQYDPPVCLNNGICKKEANQTGFTCYCGNNAGNFYLGTHCEKTRQHCELEENPPACHNGGTCYNLENDYECICAPGFTDITERNRCRVNIDECASDPCQNNATCIDGIASYECLCPPGLTGDHCQINVDECESSPCLNGGRCIDAINRYVCDCGDTGFEGFNCELNIDDCAISPCFNGGTCLDGVKNYTCQCYDGYMGVSCQEDINECISQPCHNGATCRQFSDPTRLGFSYLTAAGFDCECAPGYNGTLCKEDIDECEVDPCRNGACQDRINSYFCLCDPGYTGVDCDVNIDECDLWDPCKNGAQCLDEIAGYQCICAPEVNGISYGGVNCTVLHTGCDAHVCQNEAKCTPYLVSEIDNIHNYTCQCRPGFTGFFCEVSTTATFNGDSWMKSTTDVKLSELAIDMQFRTTLPNGTLFHMSDASGTKRVYLVLAGPQLLTLYVTIESSQTFSLSGYSNGNLNDAVWHSVRVFTRDGQLVLGLGSSDCLPSNCESTRDLFLNEDPQFSTTLFGGLSANVQEPTLSAQAGPLTGCLQDIKVNNQFILPSHYIADPQSSFGVSVGCPREDPCVSQPCQNSGVCVDLWNKFFCQCVRPFIGETCNTSVTPITFGYRNSPSSAEFQIPPEQQIELAHTNLISLFFRTREDGGLLVYLGPKLAKTFLRADLRNGFVVVSYSLSPVTANEDLVMDAKRYDDGKQHFLQINRTRDHLRVTVDDQFKETPVNAILGLTAEYLYLGSFPSGARRKRSVPNQLSPGAFKGTLQDVRLNGQLAEIYGVNASQALPRLAASAVNGVLEGEVDDDLCGASVLCEQNATCESVFFNDYKCHCPEGFKGKNCSELNFCIYNQCPGSSTCNDLSDGHECTIPATFNGQSTMLKYSTGFATQRSERNTIKMALRTRATGGLVFHVHGANVLSTYYLTLQLLESDLILRYDLGEYGIMSSSDVLVNDGLWHNISISIQTELIEMTVDDITSARFTTQPKMLSELLNSTSDIYVGGVPQNYYSQNPNQFQIQPTFFKGCMDEVRIDNVLLPYFTFDDGYNSSAKEQFNLVSKTDITTGCNGDPVCLENLCVNGADCVDIWNDYMCSCQLGFNGTYCENNIDDCVNHGCLNGGVCVDEIANYSCLCIPGYTDDRCQTEIDECASDPCQNNATCYDQVNGYFCNCSANYTGANCEISVTERCDNETDYPCRFGKCNTVETAYEGVVTFSCACFPGYTGRLCESEIDYCEVDPCINGTCRSNISLLDYECLCQPGFTNKNCSQEIDECQSNPCKNGGTCTDELNGYTCNCTAAWMGEDCGVDVNECNSTAQLCERGTCVNTDGAYYCDCTTTGYEGDRCQLEINECRNKTHPVCLNDGDCINLNGSYRCNCKIGYEGDRCQTPNCTGVCLQDGNCSISDQNKWACSCPQHHEGDRCEYRGPCAETPCENGGVCSQQHGGGDNFTFSCTCQPGWKGQNCSEDINECDSSPCRFGATCVNTPGDYNCICVNGYTGRNCDSEIDECASDPCVNGQCINGIGQYTCNCTGTGYEGINCERDINECNNDPCVNGTCVNLEGSFKCDCFSGSLGPLCEYQDPCDPASPPCANDGNCSSTYNETAKTPTFECFCTPEFQGPYCGEKIGASGQGDNVPINLIIGLSVFALLLLVFIAVIGFMLVAKSKRATRGTYSPSRQEMSGSRVEMGNVLKPPPEERLI